jgi:thimet oligopeptidase
MKTSHSFPVWKLLNHLLCRSSLQAKVVLSTMMALSFYLPATFPAFAAKSSPATQGVPMSSELIRYSYSPGEVTRLCDAAIEHATKLLDEIAKIPSDHRTPKNTLMALEQVTADFSDAVTPLTFMGYVSTDAAVNKEGSECEQKVSQFSVSIFTRKDLYDAIKNQKSLSAPQIKLHAETLKTFEDNGLMLSDNDLKKVKELKQSLASLESKFSTHLNLDQSTVEFTAEELAGVPADFIASLKKASGGKFIVTTKEPDYVRLMDNATHSEARRKMQEAYENRSAKENVPLLEEAIQIRQKIAALMGFPTWADYRLHTRMAKNSKTVLSFLNGLKDKLSQRSRDDLAQLLKLKKEVEPGATELKAWDIRYFANQLKKKEFSLDDEKIREYFPADLAVSGMFHVYSKLLGVEYIAEKSAKTWADGVKLYRIQNAKDHHLIGYFYADFVPRPGKYGHAAAFTLISGRTLPDGSYSHPVAAIVANFSAPENGKPSLLKHEEVRTLFHEFGHIMHQTLTKVPYASLSGSSVDQDFVEAPSQMLENWVFSPEILSNLSGYYKDHSQKLPPDLLKKLIAARDFNQGYFYTRQLFLALLDMNYHTLEGKVDTTQLYYKLYKDILSIDPVPDGHFQASFGHLMGGYDAGYYGYLWSEVYAADMFTRFEKEGLLNVKVGADYRHWILEQGKMLEGAEILKKFLGRDPNNNAFYKKLKLSH